MRSADDDASGGMQGPGQVGDSGRRHRPEQDDIQARRRQPRLQRRLEHVAGQAGVLADQYLPAALSGKHATGGPAQLEHAVGSNGKFPHPAADAIRSEQALRHTPLRACDYCFTHAGPLRTSPYRLTACATVTASTVGRTSCARTSTAPARTAITAAARLPYRRSPVGRSSMAPIIDLRDMPTRTG